MYKNILIIGIIILVVCICLSGCNENLSKEDDTKKFIGTWDGSSYFLNETTKVTLTFYDDNTIKQVSDETHTHWFNFEIVDNCLKLIFPELPEEYAICYSYEFSNNYNALTLKNESLDTLILNKQ